MEYQILKLNRSIAIINNERYIVRDYHPDLGVVLCENTNDGKTITIMDEDLVLEPYN